MDTVITVDLMVRVLVAMCGVIAIFGGAFVTFATGMASAPSAEDRKTGNKGCATSVLGIAAVVYSIFFW